VWTPIKSGEHWREHVKSLPTLAGKLEHRGCFSLNLITNWGGGGCWSFYLGGKHSVPIDLKKKGGLKTGFC